MIPSDSDLHALTSVRSLDERIAGTAEEVPEDANDPRLKLAAAEQLVVTVDDAEPRTPRSLYVIVWANISQTVSILA